MGMAQDGHALAMRGWPAGVRNLANRSTGKELATEVRDWGPVWQGGAGPGLAWALLINVRGWGGRVVWVLSLKVSKWEAELAQGRPIVPWWIRCKGQAPQTN